MCVYRLSRGQKSPFGPLPVLGECATLVVDATASILLISISWPTEADILSIEAGQIDVGLDWQGTTAFFLWRFCGPDGHMLFDTQLHVGLERHTAFPNLSTTGLGPGEGRCATVVMQDEFAVVRAISIITLPRVILGALKPLLARQLGERRRRDLFARHRQDVETFYDRLPNVGSAFDAAPVKGRVR